MLRLRWLIIGGSAALTAAARAQAPSPPPKAPPHYIADSLLDPGRLHWLRYDLYAYRWTDVIQHGDCRLALDAITQAARADSADARALRAVAANTPAALARCARPVGSAAGFPGETDYLYAERFYRATFDSVPGSPQAFRRLATLLAERNRWRELQSAARTHLRNAADDAWGWLTLGLALYRQGTDSRGVESAFDSAFAHLAPDEIRRLNHLERVLRPTDSLRIASLDASTHTAIQQLYWTSADPLWSRTGNEPHVEFLARVVFAELRWSVEEMGVRGAETDRGDVYIRYGPPDAVIASRGDCPPPSVGDAWVVTSWVYYMRPSVRQVSDTPQDRGPPFSFLFCGMPMFATAAVPPGLQQIFGEILASDPVRWDNIRAISVDTMPVQAARFRASADSIDIVIATLPPFAAIRRASTVASPVQTDVWILAGGTTSIAHDSATLSQPGVKSVRHRVAAGNYAYRAEASADGSQYAGRATAAFGAGPDSANAFPTRGFGMSDVLIATSASAPRTVRRWSDIPLEPLAGAVTASANLTLVWESYDVGATNGSARYDVTIALERARSGVGRVAARIVSNVGGAVGINRADNRISMQYERTVAHAPVLVDNIALSLAGTPPGQYRLSVSIIDRTTKQVATRTTILTVKE